MHAICPFVKNPCRENLYSAKREQFMCAKYPCFTRAYWKGMEAQLTGTKCTFATVTAAEAVKHVTMLQCVTVLGTLFLCSDLIRRSSDGPRTAVGVNGREGWTRADVIKTLRSISTSSITTPSTTLSRLADPRWVSLICIFFHSQCNINKSRHSQFA